MQRLEDQATELPPDLSHGVPKNISSSQISVIKRVLYGIFTYPSAQTYTHIHVRPQTEFEASGSVLLPMMFKFCFVCLI